MDKDLYLKNKIYFLKYIKYIYFLITKMGIGDGGLGIGDWAQSPIPNPQSPIPNPQYSFAFILVIKK